LFDNAKNSQANTARSKQLKKTDTLRLSILFSETIGMF